MLDVENKLCLITGGSTGLGLSLSKQLAQRGAHICILSRRESVLQAAVKEIKKCCQNDTQRVEYISTDCTNIDALEQAALVVEKKFQLLPFLLICSVGKVIPKPFLTYSHEEFNQHMQWNYFSTLYTIQTFLPRLLKQVSSSHIVLVSSLAGFVGFAGYSAYAPCKAALRSLADTLRHELLTTPIQIHVFFPGNFTSPGYEEELITKPFVAKYLDEQDPLISSDTCAMYCLKGLDKHQFHITTSLNGELIRCSGQVHAPSENAFFDFIKCMLAFMVLGFWRYTQLDSIIKKHPVYPQASSSVLKKEKKAD